MMNLTSQQFEKEPIDELVANTFIANQVAKKQELEAKHAGK